MNKAFHLGDILSITTGRLVSPRKMDGIYDILNFMTGDNLFTHQLPRAGRECKPELKKQFPQLATAEMNFEVAEISEMLETPSGKNDPGALVDGWLAKQIVIYGEYLEVSPLPKELHTVKNTLTELEELIDPHKIITLVVGE